MPDQLNLISDNRGTINIDQRQRKPAESKTTPITFKVEDSDKAQLADFCLHNDVSISKCVKDAIKHYMRSHPHLGVLNPLIDKLSRP